MPTTTKPQSLDDLLEVWSVMAPGQWENEASDSIIGDWYAVVNDEKGIIAYFGDEQDACRFRLSEINRVLNG